MLVGGIDAKQKAAKCGTPKIKNRATFRNAHHRAEPANPWVGVNSVKSVCLRSAKGKVSMNTRGDLAETNTGLHAAGVNLGFGFVKVVTGYSPDSQFRLASVVREADRSLAWHRRTPGVVRARWNGLEYEVGEQAVLHGTGHQLKALHRDWADSLPYQVLAQTVIDWLARRARNWSVVVGLALDHYRDEAYRRRVAAFWAREWTSPSGPVRVARVRVLPETAGAANAILAMPRLRKRLATDTVALLDFGRLTTNWILLQNGTMVPGRSGSLDVGMSAVLARAATDLGRQIGRPQLSDMDIEMALIGKSAVLTRSESADPVDVRPFVLAATGYVWPRIEAAVRSSLGDTRGVDLLAVGGAAGLFRSHVETLRDSKLLDLEGDLQMLNAVGLYQGAQSDLARRRNATASPT